MAIAEIVDWEHFYKAARASGNSTKKPQISYPLQHWATQSELALGTPCHPASENDQTRIQIGHTFARAATAHTGKAKVGENIQTDT